MDIIQRLSTIYDAAMLQRPSTWLQQWDKPVAVHMKHHHRFLAKLVRKNQRNPEVSAKPRFKNSAEALKKVYTDNRSLRKGGLGSLLTLAFGEGTSWHRDRNDYPGHYSVVTVTGGTAILYLQGVNQGVRIKEGDVVAFLASQVTHKLVWESEADGPRFVYTCFTCKQAMKCVEGEMDRHHRIDVEL